MDLRRKKIELYRSLDELSIYRFDKIISGDLRYLSKKDDITYVKISDVYNDVWKDLYNQYAEKTKNNTTVRSYLLIGEINYLSLKLYIVPTLIDVVLSPTTKNQFLHTVNEIRNWGFPIDNDENLAERFKKISESLKNSKTKLKRKKAEYKELTKENENRLSIIQQKVKLERALGVSIDVNKTSVIEWLAYWDEMESMIQISKNKKLSG